MPERNDFIPVNEPLLDGNELAYVTDCVKSGWISSEGSYVSAFEEALAERCDRTHGIAVTNGSVALELAVESLDIGEGDEIVLPTFTIVSCLAPVLRRGATPVFVDADPVTWTMDVSALDSLVTTRTRAIMPVHIYGLPVDMDPILEVADRHGLAVIEDAAEAAGSLYRGHPCGSFGDVSCFSFYANKHVTTGEGGMLLTDDDDLAKRLRSLRNLCFQPGRRFVHEELGHNARMTNLQAAIGLAQVESLDRHIARKRELGERYRAGLADVAGLEFAPASTAYADNDHWVFGFVIDDELPTDAAGFAARLAAHGIGTRPFFFPLHLQPALRAFRIEPMPGRFPVAERLAERGLYLPSGLGTTDDQIDRAVDAVRSVLDEIR